MNALVQIPRNESPAISERQPLTLVRIHELFVESLEWRAEHRPKESSRERFVQSAKWLAGIVWRERRQHDIQTRTKLLGEIVWELRPLGDDPVAQRIVCEGYIAAQRKERWRLGHTTGQSASP